MRIAVQNALGPSPYALSCIGAGILLRVTIRLRSTLLLNTSCHSYLCLILFPARIGRWTYVFRIERSVKFFAPRLSNLTTSRGVPIVRH